ncbi:MAG: phenylalanine--tRNA ligase subunit alpha, partial [Muribaculaceae bacterium]|nr:phenylalanine--tRNA ligase subunit alpha [Muribaculaceae bacterium]
MIDKINSIREEVAAATASNVQEVEELRIKYLSKKGVVSALMADFRNVPAEQKRELGQLLNQLKNDVTDKINSLKENLSAGADNEASSIDLTRTATPFPVGSRHPLSIVKDDIIRIFSGMGFTIAEGPEIEDDWHVFSSLNFPED